MNLSRFRITFTALLLSLSAASMLSAEPARITVKANQPGIAISPTLYGVFYEEINRAGDGGLYGEMIQNRSFEDTKSDSLSVKPDDQPGGWDLVKEAGADVSMALDDSKPLSAGNKHCLKVIVIKPGKGAGVANAGFRNYNFKYKADDAIKSGVVNGIAVQKGRQYNYSLYVRGDNNFNGPLTLTIAGKNGILAATEIKGITSDWKRFAGSLKVKDTDPDTKLVITSAVPGIFYLDMVSMFPKDTFKHRPYGLRIDLAQMVADLKPRFVRFPGGCFVEGNTLDNANRWKKTIGDIADRPGHWNLWGYWSNDGLGAYEFLQYCEDIHAEPLYVINCGLSHHEQWNRSLKPEDYHVDVQEYLQDALDFIEYANGPADSRWGSLRAKAGHPKPFNLKYMEIGNENGGPIYDANYKQFKNAILAKYPYMQLVSNTKEGVDDISDEHYYDSPSFFFRQANKYDRYDRKGPKVYIGEYAVTRRCGKGNLIAALGEAAFMTGMERNADVVKMGSYAPLFVNPEWSSWNPNAIVFDAARAYGTPSYYVQKIFSNNKADINLPVNIISNDVAPEPVSGAVGVGTMRAQVEFKDIKVTGPNGELLYSLDDTTGLDDWKKYWEGKWQRNGNVIEQSDKNRMGLMYLDRKNMSHCTLTLKARRMDGDGDINILFDTKGTEDRNMWHLGGFSNNSFVSWEQTSSDRKKLTIETGCWYDLKVEINGVNVKCYLDGVLMHDLTRTSQWKSLFAVAGRMNGSKEVILKVVNVSSQPQITNIVFTGSQSFASGKAIVLTGDGPDDENSFTTPRKIVPKEELLGSVPDNFVYTFKPYSVTVLRLQESQ